MGINIKRVIEYKLKHNPACLELLMLCGSAFFKFLGTFIKTDDQLMLFTSFSGKQYNDSPKKIYEYLKSIPEGNRFKYVWAFEKPDAFPLVDCKKVKIDTWEYFVTTLRARYWITSVNIERGMKYKKSQIFYLNTWHGPAINLMGNAVAGRNDFQWDHIDRFCISGTYERKIITQDFCVKPEALFLSGLPRNDELYHVTEEKKIKLKKDFGIAPDKKVVLYAPTWRESMDGGKSCNLEPPIHFEKWKKRLGNGFVIYVRAHVNTQDLLGIHFDEEVRDVSGYPDVNDLLIIADYLVSDYSSIIMDYSILGRPIICFGYDYDEYSKARGGFYFDLNAKIPSGICRTEDEVLNYILSTDYQEECKKVSAFRDEFMEAGGNATQMCVEELLKA